MARIPPDPSLPLSQRNWHENSVLFEQVESVWWISGYSAADREKASAFGFEFGELHSAELENELFAGGPQLAPGEIDQGRLRQAFRNAIIRTFITGEYRRHPSAWGAPKRWMGIPPNIDARLRPACEMIEFLELTDDGELADIIADSVIGLLSKS